MPIDFTEKGGHFGSCDAPNNSEGEDLEDAAAVRANNISVEDIGIDDISVEDIGVDDIGVDDKEEEDSETGESIEDVNDVDALEGSDVDVELLVARIILKSINKVNQGRKEWDAPDVQLGPAEDDVAFNENDKQDGRFDQKTDGIEEHLDNEDPDSRFVSYDDSEGEKKMVHQAFN